MADGSTRPIQDIEVGDAVATFAVGGADYPCYDLFIAIQAQDH
jgi:hypothetical protein